jgi:hypothetical protein
MPKLTIELGSIRVVRYNSMYFLVNREEDDCFYTIEGQKLPKPYARLRTVDELQERLNEVPLTTVLNRCI